LLTLNNEKARKKILPLLDISDKPLTMPEIAKIIGYGHVATTSRLSKLLEDNKVHLIIISGKKYYSITESLRQYSRGKT